MSVPNTHVPATAGQVSIRTPGIADGECFWRLAVESQTLDVNSRYAYLLWCRDFAETSLLAHDGDTAVGFVTGYRRPDEPGTVVVWQIAVAAEFGGRGIASTLLDELLSRLPEVDFLETTITPDNVASQRLFEGLARRRGAQLRRSELFSSAQLGQAHLPEILHRIGPLRI